MKLKHSNVQSITNLNLWGSDLDDISLLAQMPMLEIVSLSVNKIRSLKPFLNHQHLKQLSLRKNLICDFGEVKYLSTCPNLSILWLNENPISDSPNYRSTVIKLIPSLVKLDDIPISDSERDQCLCRDYSNDYQQPQYYRYERQHGRNLISECFIAISGNRSINVQRVNTEVKVNSASIFTHIAHQVMYGLMSKALDK